MRKSRQWQPCWEKIVQIGQKVGVLEPVNFFAALLLGNLQLVEDVFASKLHEYRQPCWYYVDFFS